MINNSVKLFGIICAVIINIILIIAVVISVLNTINDVREKKKNGLLMNSQVQNNEEKIEDVENYEQQEQGENDEINFSVIISYIKDLGLNWSDIIKIILILIAIILFIYFLIKIR